jgi:hypothetical protein
MRLICLLFTATLVAGPEGPGQQPPSPPEDLRPKTEDTKPAPADHYDLPVSLEKIKGALEQAPTSTLTLKDLRPTFRIQILERQRIEELLATLNYKTSPTPAGGVYWNEVQRVMWPAVDNPLRQPYSAFSGGELLTILIENLIGKYAGEKIGNAISSAKTSGAQKAARDEVLQAIRDYCAAQPSGGAGISICATSAAAAAVQRP